MSYILDALKKSEAERERAEPAKITAEIPNEVTPDRRRWPLLIGVVVIINVAVLGYVMWPSDEPVEIAAIEPEDTVETPPTTPPPVQKPEPEPATLKPQAKTPPVVSAKPKPVQTVTKTETKKAPVAKPAPVAAATPETDPAPAASAPTRLQPPTAALEAPAPIAKSAPESASKTAPKAVPVTAPVTAPKAAPKAAPKPAVIPDPMPKPKVVAKRPTPKPAPVPAPAPRKTISAASSGGDGLEYATAYYNRGWAYAQKNMFDKAILDYTQAIRLEGDHADAFFARAWAYEKSNKFDKASADYSSALRLKPGYALAYNNRGVISLRYGKYDKAAKDFASAFDVADAGLKPYTALWLFLSRERGGTDGRAELINNARTINQKKWPGIIVTLFQGLASENKVIAQTRDANAQKQREKECVAYFFMGQLRLINGDIETAVRYFENTIRTGVTSYLQYDAAREELRRLGRL